MNVTQGDFKLKLFEFRSNFALDNALLKAYLETGFAQKPEFTDAAQMPDSTAVLLNCLYTTKCSDTLAETQ